MFNKKLQREEFRTTVFERDKYACVMCGYKPEDPTELDAHHITDRHFLPNGGYCRSNGITLCTDRCKKAPWIGATLDCHQKAEHLHAVGVAIPGYTPNDLYGRIKSSYKTAYRDSLKLSMQKVDTDALMNTIGKISIEELDVCLRLCDEVCAETWELTCYELGETESFVIAYGKGRQIC